MFFDVKNNFGAPDLHLLQQNIWKRLQYAMPRVPLKKLKAKKRYTEDPPETSDTMVGAIAKRIHEAHKLRRNTSKGKKELLGGDIEHNEPESEKNDSDQVYFEDNRLEGATAMARAFEPKRETLHRNRQEHVLWKQQLNIGEKEIEQINSLEAKIQNDNKGRNLRLVLVESDMEKNLPGSDEHNNEDIESSDQERIVELPISANIEAHMCKDSSEMGVKDEQHLFVVKDNSADDGYFMCEIHATGGARPKTKRVKGQQQKKAAGKQKMTKKIQKKAQGKKQKAQVVWGLDESSESDSGWDCDEGDIPLLPRERMSR